MARPRHFLPVTKEAAELLGARVAVARRERRWTIAELAERVGVSYVTVQKVERGNLSVSLGTAFETAAVLGIPLFDQDPERRADLGERYADRLAVLPRTVRPAPEFDDDF